MPIFEFACQSCGAVQERYLSRADNEDPPCEIALCGGETRRMISQFGIVWCGSMSRYNQKTEGTDPTFDMRSEGYFATAIRTPDGKPKQVWIDSVQKSREFAKSEGLIPPDQLGNNMVATSDKTVSERGMPGCW